jgi:tRNA(Ser,Leu) C12 N-acetylase TAN1
MDKKDFEKPYNKQKESRVPVFEKEADLPSEVKSVIDQIVKTIKELIKEG